MKKKFKYSFPEIVEYKEGIFTLCVITDPTLLHTVDQKQLRKDCIKILTKALGYKPKTYKQYVIKYVKSNK